MVSNIEFFSNVATATLADASTALGLNLIMDAPRPVVPESYPHFAGPAATLVFAPIQGPRKAPYSLYDVVDTPASILMDFKKTPNGLAYSMSKSAQRCATSTGTCSPICARSKG